MLFSQPKVTAMELDAYFAVAGEDDRLQAAGLGVIADRRPRVRTKACVDRLDERRAEGDRRRSPRLCPSSRATRLAHRAQPSA